MLTPEFEKYTLAELHDVLRVVDAERYPDNYQKVTREIARKEKLEKERLKKEISRESLNKEQRNKVEKQAITSYWDPASAKRDQQQVITWLGFIKLGIILAVFCSPVYFNSFLLSPNYGEVVSNFSWLISIFAAVAYGFSKLKYRREKMNCQSSLEKEQLEQNKDVQAEIQKANSNEPWLIVLVAIIILVTTFFISSKSLPVLAHIYVVENFKATKVVTVNRKARRFRKKHCNGKVYLNEYRDMQLDYICGVLSKKTWTELEPDDSLKLYGSQSSIGFLVQKAARVK